MPTSYTTCRQSDSRGSAAQRRKACSPTHRRATGYREFEPTAREQVQRIRALLAIGLTLAEGRRLSPCLKDQRSEIPLCQAALDAHQRQLAALDERIHALQEIRQRIMDYLDASDVPHLMFRGLKRLEVKWDGNFI